ncbi:hypothetical protein B7494_g164 [Chlorociboria aeruginascens]|nr:hypothetical protein B7494_g164 [Chlorociboria aeruginascens]
MSAPIILILGAGPNVGASVFQKFATHGYKTALVSRTQRSLSPSPDVAITADISSPAAIKPIFDEVREKLGVPDVVVYNAYGNAMSQSPWLVPLADFEKNLALNTTSVYAAIHECISSWEEAKTPGNGVGKTFIYTGNRLNIEPMPLFMSMGVGKTATAQLIRTLTIGFAGKYRFYYADERKANGAPISLEISGKAAAEFYYELVQRKEQGNWNAKFVEGKGEVDFEE